MNECAAEKSAPHRIGYAVETYDTTTTRMEIKLGGELEHITHLGLTPCLQQKIIAARHRGTCVRVHTPLVIHSLQKILISDDRARYHTPSASHVTYCPEVQAMFLPRIGCDVDGRGGLFRARLCAATD